MSLFDYRASRRLNEMDPSFTTLIMAAMRKADSHNAALLRASWPEIWSELEARYNAPGGRLEGEDR